MSKSKPQSSQRAETAAESKRIRDRVSTFILDRIARCTPEEREAIARILVRSKGDWVDPTHARLEARLDELERRLAERSNKRSSK
jgi:hypothetical protein